MSSSEVADGRVIEIEYTLTNPQGEVLDASEGEPLAYLHGADNIVPGLENALVGKSVGDKLDVVVPPAEGYGERQGPGPQGIPRTSFPADADIVPGMSFAVETEDGQLMPLWVVGLEADQVMVDANHPLAGVALHFAVEIVGIRDARAEELEHGHPHGPGGHHH